MNPRELIRAAEASFRFAGIPDPEYDSSVLLSHLTGRSPLSLRLDEDTVLDADTLARFDSLRERRLQREPLQYILAEAPFFGRFFYVDPNVLIPRPETEEIVLRATELLNDSGANVQEGNFLDLCTGSGCIAIALKHRFPSAEVTAVDISPTALAIARDNAAANHTDIHFVEADVLDPVKLAALTPSYDLIVSNPPYVMERERADMQPNVLNYDPALALFVPDSDPLRFYRAIGQYAATHLAPQGLLALEINQALSTETMQLLQALGFDTQLHHDFRGNPRCITASLPPTP
jgi:release factor glutamine methyltransferase